MKNIFIVFVTSILLWSCSSDVVKVQIVSSVATDDPVLMYYIENGDYKSDTLKFDANNTISLELTKSQLNDFSFYYQRTALRPVLNMGDKLQIELIKSDEGIEVKYQGDGAVINNYKQDRASQVGYSLLRSLYAGDLKTDAFSVAAKKIDQLQNEWLKKLENANISDEAFIEKEKRFLHYFFTYTKGAFANYNQRNNNAPIDSDEDYVRFMKALEEEPNDEQVEMYYQVFEQKVSWYMAMKREQQALGDSVTIIELNTINRHIQSSELKNKMLSRTMAMYLSYSVNDLIEETYDLFVGLCDDEKQKVKTAELYENAKKLMPGQPAPDFDMYTKEGEKVMLSDFKGKYVYFDVWATWCGPCKAEIPYVAKLVEELKNEDRLEIISISVDSSHEAWVEMIEEDQPNWKQFIVKDAFNSSLTKQYNISGIPQFVLIDADGNIVDVQAARPSNPGLLVTLKKLLSEN